MGLADRGGESMGPTWGDSWANELAASSISAPVVSLVVVVFVAGVRLVFAREGLLLDGFDDDDCCCDGCDGDCT